MARHALLVPHYRFGSVAVVGLVLPVQRASYAGPFLGRIVPVRWAAGRIRTRSAFVALLSFLVIAFTQGRGLRVRQLIVPFVMFAFGVFVMDAMTSTTEFVVRDAQSIGSMSDRIPLWRSLTSTVKREAPLTGLGYYAASRLRTRIQSWSRQRPFGF